MKIHSFKNRTGLAGSTSSTKHQSGLIKVPKLNKTKNRDQNWFFNRTGFKTIENH